MAPRDPSYPRRPREQCSRLLNYSLWLLAFVSVRSTRPLLLISPPLFLSRLFPLWKEFYRYLCCAQSSWDIYIFIFFCPLSDNTVTIFTLFRYQKVKKKHFIKFLSTIFLFSFFSYIGHTGYYFYVSRVWEIRSGNFYFYFSTILQLTLLFSLFLSIHVRNAAFIFFPSIYEKHPIYFDIGKQRETWISIH